MHRIVTFKLDSRILEIVDRLARKRRVTRSEIIREALYRFLMDEEGIEVYKYLYPRYPEAEEGEGEEVILLPPA
ncbi:MAG: ribbon-helix-helix protein, CopG family [Crenarchaeota archaeon]|nr:ribbon-helix-helix protein, CopG family [Thermoproteota archaeon]